MSRQAQFTFMDSSLDAAERGDLQHIISGATTLNNSAVSIPQRSWRPSISEKGDYEGNQDAIGTPRRSKIRTIHNYFGQELQVEWMSVAVLICFFASGLIDAVAFNSWNCFVGMQTGNTVFAALGLGGQPRASHKQQYYKSLVAIASFCLGTLFFNFLHRLPTGLAQQPSSRRRTIFSSSFFIQMSFITIAASMVQTGQVSNQPYISGTFSSGSRIRIAGENPIWTDLAAIAMLSFQSAGQVCLSRVLGVIELPTIVLSTLYHDFTADLYTTRKIWKESSSVREFFTVRYKRQEKRFLSIVALFLGALIGGEMYKSKIGMAGALWLAVVLKFTLSLGFLVWRPEEVVNTDLPR